MLLDAHGVVLASNDTAAERLGVTVERLVGSSLFVFFPPEVAEEGGAYLDAILHSRQPIRFIDQRDGKTYDNHVTLSSMSMSDVIRLAAFGQDITQPKRAEEALRASEEKYRLLFQNMVEGFALYELLYDEQGEPADWRVLEVNDAYTLHTGIAREQIVGRRISELFPAAISEYLPRFSAVVATQTPSEFETYARRSAAISASSHSRQEVAALPTSSRISPSANVQKRDCVKRKRSWPWACRNEQPWKSDSAWPASCTIRCRRRSMASHWGRIRRSRCSTKTEPRCSTL